LGFDKSQRSVTHESLRYINILTYLLTYLLTSKFRLGELKFIYRLPYSVLRHILNVKFYAIFVFLICYLCCKAASCQLFTNKYSIL